MEEGLVFYRTKEWKQARDTFLKENPWGSCPACKVKFIGFQPMVDHIKPLRLHWNLRLDPGNFQFLCSDCNQMKGNKDNDLEVIGQKVLEQRFVHGIRDLLNPAYARRTAVILKRKAGILEDWVTLWEGGGDATLNNRAFRAHIIGQIESHMERHPEGKNRIFDDGVRVLAEEYMMKAKLGAVRAWYKKSAARFPLKRNSY